MKKSIITILLLTASITAFSQFDVDLTKFGFKKTPPLTKEEVSYYSEYKAVCLYISHIIEYRLNNENRVEVWEALDQIFIINDKALLEELKESHIYSRNEDDIIACGGRRIAANGQVEELTKKDLVRKIDENNDSLRALIFSNASVGDIIEYYSIVRKNSIPEIGSYNCPSSLKIKEYDFTLICPSHLNFELVGYNGMPYKSKDTLMDDIHKRYLWLHSDQLPEYNDDLFCFRPAHLPRVEYTLTYNYSNSRQRLKTLDAYAASLYSYMNDLSKTEQKLFKKINKSIKIDKKSDILEKIKTIEDSIKNRYEFVHYTTSRDNFPYFFSLGGINQASSWLLFYNIFKMNDINVELFFTVDKTRRNFDKKFNGLNFMDELVFYFPDINEYMSPDYFNLRVGFPSSNYTGIEGMLFKKAALKEAATFYPVVHTIPVLSADKSGDTIDVRLSIDAAANQISAKLHRSLTGYFARMQYTLSQLDLKDDEDADISNIIDHYAGLSSESMNVVKYEIQNIEKNDIAVKPLVFESELEDFYLLKNSRDTLLLTVGAFIGKQDNSKQEKPRTLPVEREANYHYDRTIRIDIPEGYHCVNLSEMETAVYDEASPRQAQAAFVVTAWQEADQIIIHCQEYYSRVYYPVEEANKYIDIMSAAARFNSAVLKFVK